MLKVAAFARERCQDSDFGHTVDHVNLTVELAKYLANKEKANEEVCIVAAYLHDIAKNSSRSHGLQGAKDAAEFLAEIGVNHQLIEDVAYAISQHDNDLPKETLESKILWDADKLQSIGPLGFVRIFGNRIISNQKDIYYAIEQAEYWEQFFFERFYTETGRAAALPLHQYMTKFFRLCDLVLQAELDSLLAANSPRAEYKKERYAPQLTSSQKDEIVNFAREMHKSGDFHHGIDHVELTVKLADYLARKEHADEEICNVSAYLHDIAKAEIGAMPKGNFKKLQNKSDGHGKLGAEKAGEFLKKLGVPDSFAEQVHYAIAHHDNDHPKRTLEAKVLWDADKLQLVGPFGFARIIQYYLVYLQKDINYAIEQAKCWQQFFFERFCTETGRALAIRLHEFMKEFYRLLDVVRELRLESLLAKTSKTSGQFS